MNGGGVVVAAHLLGGLVAVHSVSWSLRSSTAQSRQRSTHSTAPFIPVSLTPLVAAPVWDPVDSWAVVTSAGILLALAIASLRFQYGPLRSNGPPAIWSAAWPVAVAQILIFLLFATSIALNDASWLTHLVCAGAGMVLWSLGVLFA